MINGVSEPDLVGCLAAKLDSHFLKQQILLMADSIKIVASVKDDKVHSLDFASDEQQIRTLSIIAKRKGQRIECMDIFIMPTLPEPQETNIDNKKDLNDISRMHVKWIEKGIVAENATHMAEYTGINPSTIFISLSTGRTIRGRTFAFTSEPLNIEPKQLMPYIWPGAFKVSCQETGKVYESVKEASNETKISLQQVYYSVRTGYPVQNLTFIRVKE